MSSASTTILFFSFSFFLDLISPSVAAAHYPALLSSSSSSPVTDDPPPLAPLNNVLATQVPLHGASRRILERDSLRRRLRQRGRTHPAAILHHVDVINARHLRRSSVEKTSRNGLGQPPLWIEVPVVSAGERRMLYYAEVAIGTPPSPFRLAVDSGSDPTWVNCTLTSSPPSPNVRVFDADRSSTFFPMPLGCNQAHPCFYVYPPPGETEPNGQRRQCAEIDAGLRQNLTGPCTYEYSYVDGTRTRGIYAFDSLTFEGDAAGRKVETLALGCGDDNVVGESRDFDGVMGLGRGGGLTLPYQLSAPSFAHCFQPLTDVNSRSMLVFGDDPLMGNKTVVPMQYTPLMIGAREALHLTSYYVQVRGVSVNGRALHIRASSWARGTTIVDMGSSYSYVPHDAYFAIVDGIKAAAATFLPVYDPTTGPQQLCYNSSHFHGIQRHVRLAFMMRGNVALSVPADNLFVRFAHGSLRCLVIHPIDVGAGPDEPVFGNHLFQNLYVQYDRRQNRLGWARARCAH